MCAASAQTIGTTVPETTATALDGHAVRLPSDLRAKATVLVIGFSRKSGDSTMMWERAVRGPLDKPPAVATYVAAMLAEVPGFARGFVLRSIRKQVPAGLQPHFLVFTSGEADWKRAAGFVGNAADAAYVLLVDDKGRVVWTTHEAFSPAVVQTLRDNVQKLEATTGP